MNLAIILTSSDLMSSCCVSGNIPRSLGDVLRNWSMSSIGVSAWRMGMEDDACTWNKAHAHGVRRMRIEYGSCAWSMAHAHGVWRMRMEYGACVWSMAHAHGVWFMRME